MSNDLRILVGEPRTISTSDGYHWFTGLVKLRDGTLFLSFSTGPDAPRLDISDCDPLLKSVDGGDNWFLVKLKPRTDPLFVFQLEDDTILSRLEPIFRRPTGEVYAHSWRSHDGVITSEGPIETPIRFPEGVIPKEAEDPNYPTMEKHRVRIGPGSFPTYIQLENGDLITRCVAQFQEDEGDTKYRIIFLKSDDEGKSWSYVSTIANPPEQTPGFYEPSFALLPDGELLCMMRTVSGYTRTPMFQCRSTDRGETWSEPVSSGVIGVDPELHVMSNGVLACCYGRDAPSEVVAKKRAPFSMGCRVMFSLDGGADVDKSH